VDILFVGAKDGEDSALLAGLREESVHKHWALGEDERFPGLPFVGAVFQLIGFHALGDGHDDAAMISPSVVVRSRKCLSPPGSSTARNVHVRLASQVLSHRTSGNDETGSGLLGQDGHPPELEVEQLTEPLGQVEGTALSELRDTSSRHGQHVI